jgi:hypothetical protein
VVGGQQLILENTDAFGQYRFSLDSTIS